MEAIFIKGLFSLEMSVLPLNQLFKDYLGEGQLLKLLSDLLFLLFYLFGLLQEKKLLLIEVHLHRQPVIEAGHKVNLLDCGPGSCDLRQNFPPLEEDVPQLKLLLVLFNQMLIFLLLSHTFGFTIR